MYILLIKRFVKSLSRAFYRPEVGRSSKLRIFIILLGSRRMIVDLKIR